MKAMIIKASAGLGTWLFRRAFHLAIRAWIADADAYGAEQFTWQRSRAARRWLKREILEARQWAMRKFPQAEKTIGAAGRFSIWVLESDQLARQYNRGLPPAERLDPHKWGGYAIEAGGEGQE